LFRLRAAGRDIVEAIKDTKHMHKNLKQYVISDNKDIRAEYNSIRVQLGGVLRRLAEARNEPDDPTTVLSLDSIRLEMEENDSTANGILEMLIRENRITAPMATSLMNDYAYAYDVAKNLVQLGEVLFASRDPKHRAIDQELSLDEDEIEQTATKEPVNERASDE
ncbi:MAG: Na/Pi cotransporter family protein, partial [Gammaproteobacteria bacterium]|nr:Na/Pi cotransporter family protein [Gammaproteobacteria bacterium]